MRTWYFFLLLASVTLGYTSRIESIPWPSFYATYAGDFWWASMVYWLLAILFKRLLPPLLALYALSFSFLIEISQLYQADWINHIRQTFPGRMILGSGFKWSDLICYTFGIGLSMVLHKLCLRPIAPKN